MGTDEMSRAYSRDYKRKRHLELAARELVWICEDKPYSVSRDLLQEAIRVLQAESAHIVRVWD
jgi:hypothetical protein